LCFVPAMDLVNEQYRPAPVEFPLLLGGRGHIAHILDARQHGVQRDKARARPVRDDHGQGSLAGPRGSVEHQRGDLIGLDRATQQPPGAEHVLLAHELVQGARPHPSSEGSLTLVLLLTALAKEIHGSDPARLRGGYPLY